jgi:hypothetical protein
MGMAGEDATWAGRPEAERTESERLKSPEHSGCIDFARRDELID